MAGQDLFLHNSTIMAEQSKTSPATNIFMGLACILLGIMPMLAAFDIGPIGIEKITGPPWLGFVAGEIFVAAGLLVLLGERAPVLKHILVLLLVGSMAAIANWIAFGVGERVCSGSISFLFFFSDGQYEGLECRIPFGFGAIVFNAFLVYVFCYFLQKSQGGPPKLAGLMKLAEWLMLLALSPVLIPLILFLIVWSALGAVKTRLTTGAWPRNESFIKRRLLKKGAAKPEN